MQVPKFCKCQKHGDEYLSQLFETMVDNFMLALADYNVKDLALSSSALAALALYHYILVRAEQKWLVLNGLPLRNKKWLV